MPTHRGLWKNLETHKQDSLLARLSGGWRRPRPTGHLERMDVASNRRLGNQAFPQRLLQTHKIILLEHDYSKQGDANRTSRFSARIPRDAAGAVVPVTVDYGDATTADLSTQNEVDSKVYAADGTYTATAYIGSAGTSEHRGRRLLRYPTQFPVASPWLAPTPQLRRPPRPTPGEN